MIDLLNQTHLLFAMSRAWLSKDYPMWCKFALKGLVLTMILIADITAFAAPVDSATVKNQGLALVALNTNGSRGQGFLFLLDGDVKVLTNFHIVAGGHQITAIYRAIGPRASEVRPLWLDSANDVAVLDLDPQLKALNPDLQTIAQQTLMICTNRPQGLCQPASPPPPGSLDSILSFDGRDVSSTDMQGWINQARAIKDQYISGNYDHIWLLPAISRDGISGSSFYRDSKLMGIVTKVSRGLENKTFAIPVEGLADRVVEMSRRPMEFAPSARILLASPNSGGDTGNGGDTPASPASWLMIREYCPLPMQCENRQTTDPFFNALKDSSIEIDSKPAFVLMQHNLVQGYLFQAATQAELRLLQRLKADITVLDAHSPKLETMYRQRQAKPMNLSFIQMYRKINASTLENLYPVAGTFHDGVFTAFQIGRSESPRVMTTSPLLDDMVYSSGGDAWLGFAFAKQNLHIKIAPDLNSASIENFDHSGGVMLTAAPDSNSMKHILLSPDGRKRIMFIYNELDLTRLEGLVVDTGSSILRFSLAQPNLGFK